MNYLNLKTEYSYKHAFGRYKKVLDKCKSIGSTHAGICDRNSTFGHVVWSKYCKKIGIIPIFGVELGVVKDARIKEKQSPVWFSFIAKNNAGLKEIYELTTLSTENFYYIPRIDYDDINSISQNVFVISNGPACLDNITRSGVLQGISPSNIKNPSGIESVAMSSNLFINVEDFDAYEIVVGVNKENKTTPMHLLDEHEWIFWCQDNASIVNADRIIKECKADLPKAVMVSYKSDKTLRELCEARAPKKGIDLNEEVYKKRFDRELSLIKEKEFEDYFFVIWDLLIYAKKHMLVGPARGSSCGSLVCYLLDITEVDPIPHGLIFERFIDINRRDMPDIDIDFPDNKRDLVFDYLKDKYGAGNVARLGSVNKIQAKSAIVVTAKQLNIPPWDVKDFKESIIERSDGDENSDKCLVDTFSTLEIGKKTIEKFPQLEVATRIEAHASHAGQHAAAIVVTAHPVSNYCSVDRKTGAMQIDKHDADDLGLLKIDALGLRTLSILEDCLKQINWSYGRLIKYPLNDQAAFDLINNKRYSGIFQFDGAAVKGVCGEIKVEAFEDIPAISSIARPGPLSSGGAQIYIDRKNGEEPVYHAHEAMEPILKDTYGTFVYQEQIMMIVREIGNFSWSNTSAIRKAISKSMGEEAMNKYKEAFIDGSSAKFGIDSKTSTKIFEDICTFGSYGFNKSHAVAYGLISYWCMMLKARFPLEFSVACLRNAGKGEAGELVCIKLLRELDSEGIKYKPFDAKLSQVDWSYSDGVLIGGFKNIKGIAQKGASDMLRRRKNNEKFTPRQEKLLESGKTPFDMLYEGEELFGHIFRDPMSYNIVSRIWRLDEIEENAEGDFMVCAKIIETKIRDENEEDRIQRRIDRAKEKGEDVGDGIMTGQTLFVNCKIEDDSGKMFYARIGRQEYKTLGKKIVDDHNDGDWFLWKGNKMKGINMLFVSRFRYLGNRKEGCIC